jgi:hypothetical protein
MDDFKHFARLMLHALMQGLLLTIWIISAWATDNYVLGHFPLEGMSLVSFRCLEFMLHAATLRVVIRLIFPPSPPSGRWWL